VGRAVPESVLLAGVVLAGGESHRMGCDKATLAVPRPFPGSSHGLAESSGSCEGDITMVEHVVGIVSQRCQPVFVVAAPGQALPPLQARVLRDELRGRGTLPPIGQGLRAAAEAGARRAFVCAVDMPLLTVDVIDHLANWAAQVDADVVLPWDGHDHYLAAVYRTGLVDQVDALVTAGERSMRALVDTTDTQRIVMSDSRALTNVNSADDLRLLL
jgi:molybdopterin-guanine dinucleotide biosynthesis protein A